MPSTYTLAYVVTTMSATVWLVALTLEGVQGFRRPPLRWLFTGLFVVSELLGALFVVLQFRAGIVASGLKLLGLVAFPVFGVVAVALAARVIGGVPRRP